MDTTTVSTKFQVVIPRKVREALHIQPGQKFVVFAAGNTIQFVLVKPMVAYRGSLPGIDTTIVREEDDRV